MLEKIGFRWELSEHLALSVPTLEGGEGGGGGRRCRRGRWMGSEVVLTGGGREGWMGWDAGGIGRREEGERREREARTWHRAAHIVAESY